MQMYDISFLQRARELCSQYDVLLIFDEVATGFGRTGNRFVADLVLPDILVLGKALTGGYIGHAATVASHKVYDAFYSDDERIKEVRIMGGCACIEVKNPDTLRGYQQFAYERGVFSRPFLSYMYSMVPYS